MHIRVSIPEDDGAEARALYQWLAAEPAVRTRGHLTTETTETTETADTTETTEAGESDADMGDPFSVIALVVGSGISLGQLFVAIASWRATRPRPYRVTVELPDRTVAIETADPDEALEIARRLESDRSETD